MPEFKEGDRVIYTSGRHGTNNSNPLTPGRYACEGTVQTVTNYHGVSNIVVLWDNENTNNYSTFDLDFALGGNKTNPNIAFRIKKRNL